MTLSEARLEEIGARSYTIPTEQKESDGTLAWDSTTIVVVRTKGAARKVSAIPIATRAPPC